MKNKSEAITKAINDWRQTQKGQTDAYEYEMSFIKMWQALGNGVLQDEVGELPKRAHEKKTSNTAGRNYDSQGAHSLSW